MTSSRSNGRHSQRHPAQRRKVCVIGFVTMLVVLLMGVTGCKPVKVTLTAKVTPTGPAAQGSPVVMSGKVSPARKGGTVIIERYTGGRWIERARGPLSSNSAYAITLNPSERTTYTLRARRAATGGDAAAVSPTSNLFLGSGFFDYAGADRVGFGYGLASDVGGGTSFSPFHTMMAAYYVGREGQSKPGLSLTPSQLWWAHTGAAARALGLEGVIGTLQAGTEADFLVLNPKATPLLARKTGRAQNLDELLFSLIVLGDDRVIEKVVVA